MLFSNKQLSLNVKKHQYVFSLDFFGVIFKIYCKYNFTNAYNN